jgi:hypothetical protein
MVDAPVAAHSRWTTKRFIFSVATFITATVLLCTTRLTGEQWVWATAIIIAGHHGDALIAAWRQK